ncbi:Uncharacterized protein Adt_11086 [Abeliophyllum distichum]|uniref:Uncharacterized protein n=1 Tax=Abeliophyllum distichum TaxID=126358 RepID=A0ABD1ULV1_9LAMI
MKGPLSQTSPQAKICASLFQTTNLQGPTPLPQLFKLLSHYLNLRLRLHLNICHHMKRYWHLRLLSIPSERMLEIKEQPVPEKSQASTEFEIMQEVLGKCRGYIRRLGHGPKLATNHSVDLTSPDTESIALREQIEKHEQ